MKLDFKPATHPFKGDIIAWAEDVIYLGLGDMQLENARRLGLERAKRTGAKSFPTTEQLRYFMYDSYVKAGWDPKILRRMGFKPSAELGEFPKRSSAA